MHMTERTHVPRRANAISSFLLLHKLQVSKCCSGLCIDLLHKVTAPHHLLQNFSKLQFELIIKIAASLKVTWASHMSWPGLRILSLALLRFCNMSSSTLWCLPLPSSLSPFWLLSYSFQYDQHHNFLNMIVIMSIRWGLGMVWWVLWWTSRLTWCFLHWR